ncbi:MAG: diguanylate cyclase [Spirochaetales bacterium]|nr:diguanylate cyclase [Spirochaetales bacterium]
MITIPFLKIAIHISALISLALAIFVIAKKNKPPTLYYFAGLMFCISLYGTSYFIELSMATLEMARFWLNFEYIGLSFIPYLWFAVAWLYKGDEAERMETFKKYEKGLFLFPFLILVLVLTNPFHHLMYRSFRLLPDVSLSILVTEKGALYYPVNIFQSLVAFVGTIKMLLNMCTMKDRFRGQCILMATAALLPMAGYLINLTMGFPYNLDLGPLFFSAAGLLFFWGIVRIQLFDLTPVEKDLMLDSLDEGVLVIDKEGRLIEYNKMVKNTFFREDKFCLGKSIEATNPKLYEFLSSIEKSSDINYQRQNGTHAIFRVTRTDLTHKLYGKRGDLFVLRDITELQGYVNQLEHLASIDTLTGLPNRRQFFRFAADEIAQAERDNSPFSLIILDIDFFKRVNDTFGHNAGDEALKTVSQILGNNMRAGSLCARYGGEEFVALLPRTSSEEASKVMERLRAIIENSPVEFGEHLIQITASFGISTYLPQKGMTLDTCLDQADQAMYRAKDEGRNRVCRWD